MLRDALFIGQRDLAYLLRQREALLWVFVMPVLFFYFIGTVTGGFGGGGEGEQALPLALAGDLADGDPLLDALRQRLVGQGFAIADGAEEPERALRVEGSLAEAGAGRGPAVLTLEHRESGAGVPLDRVRVARAVYGLLADLVVLAQRGQEAKPAALAAVREEPRRLRLDVSPAGRRRDIPSGFAQAIPGTMVMFTMLVMLTSGAILLVIEREEGLLRRLASAPISRGSVVLGKWGARLALGIVQVGFGMITGTLLFGMDWGPSLAAVLVLLGAWAALNASLALLLGSVARSRGQMAGLGVMVTMTLAALGGCWWPLEITPQWMQSAAMLIPTGWTMDGLHRLVTFRDPASAALPHVAALLAAALTAGAGASRLFRYA